MLSFAVAFQADQFFIYYRQISMIDINQNMNMVSSVDEFLELCDLADYKKEFDRKGYDSLKGFLKLRNNENRITEMFEQVGMHKPGHQTRFKSQLEELYDSQSTAKAKDTVDQVKKKTEDFSWRKYAIPNPHNEKLKFYNQVTKEICKSGAEKSCRGDFEHYLIDQRQYRWTTHLQITNLETRYHKLIIDKITTDGWGKNVQRLKFFPSNPTQSDI